MSKRMLHLLMIALLPAGLLGAASDPFVGTWKLDPSKSQLSDEMKVEAAGQNRFTFDFGGGSTETIVADGTDQPGIYGTTLAVSVEGPDTWKVVRKKDGRLLISATWKLSEDGATLTDNFTGYQANGSTSSLDYVYKRTAGTSGFAGTWESTSEKMNSVYELEIKPYEADGLSFLNPAQKSAKNIKFDGKDYPSVGPNVLPGSASSGRRVDEHDLELTNKVKDKVTDTQQLKISPDLNTLTIAVHPAGRNKPNILVFDRE